MKYPKFLKDNDTIGVTAMSAGLGNSIGEFEKSHPLVGLTFNYTLIHDAAGYLDGMLSLDVPLFIHTVNGDEEQEKYFEMGISGIYTDEVK